MNHGTDYKPLEKELVFDFDADAYNEVRTCCGGSGLCEKCWLFLVSAIKLVDLRLSKDFGFEHKLWVFSGRRGVHCWVCDPRARALSPEARASILDYLSLISGGENQAKKVQLTTEMLRYPAIAQSYHDICVPMFEKILVSQQLLDSSAGWDKILHLLPKDIAQQLSEKWTLDNETGPLTHYDSDDENKNESDDENIDISLKRWHELQRALLPPQQQGERSPKRKKPNPQEGSVLNIEKIIAEIVITFTYPRFDVAVTKTIHHLLKTPFAIHPTTKKICIPIEASNCENFEIDKVPTLTDLQKQLDEYSNVMTDSNHEDQEEKVVKAYEKTSLAEPMKIFHRFIASLVVSQKKIQLQKQNQNKGDIED